MTHMTEKDACKSATVVCAGQYLPFHYLHTDLQQTVTHSNMQLQYVCYCRSKTLGPAHQPTLPTLPLRLPPAAAARRLQAAEHLHTAAAAAAARLQSAAIVFPGKLLFTAKLQPADELSLSK